jgi:hypothetical protein
MGGGGGSAKTIPPSQEYQKILNIFQRQALPAYKQWLGTQPLLKEATGLAQQQYGALPGYQAGLTQAYQQGQAALTGLPEMIKSAYGGAIPENVLSSVVARAGLTGLPETSLIPTLQNAYDYSGQIIANRGALTPDLARQATQEALQTASGAGMAHTNEAIALDLLNRQRYQQERYGTALNQALGIGQGITGLNAAQLQRAISGTGAIEALNQGALGRAQGAAQSLYSLGQAPFQNALQYAQGMQGLSGATAAQLYGAEQMPIAAYGSLFNPVGQNISDVIGYNLNAQNAANTASSNKTAGAIGGAGSAIGGIAGGVGIAL